MMRVDAEKMLPRTSNLYDTLRVVGVWKISNPLRMEKYTEAKNREASKIADQKAPSAPLDFNESYRDSMTQLGMDCLDETTGEVFLLHGTRPEHIFSILFEGLDPCVANDGNFGRGVYFADNAAKSDQYASLDQRYDKDGRLGPLHEQIYGSNPHPRNVCYCLVSRLVIGNFVSTKNGLTRQSDGESLFVDAHKSKLNSVEGTSAQPSCLVAEPGKKVSTFREVVVFSPDQIFVEYLVAYQRCRTHCCGEPMIERTVVKEGPNRGRKILRCAKECSFFQILPLCYCGQSASVKTSQTPGNPCRDFYTCFHKGWHYTTATSCDFFQWKEDSMKSK